ncbi:hypothetical protein J3458_012681 [Metarhizium acridum]|uniref:uncharacterized protein n=1 Tax=Metarhizium acridum TaxID=92637 RepID=UPI001C6ABE1A|nr:hypothetical protein J3458_012681 [Metarhizium acridum]
MCNHYTIPAIVCIMLCDSLMSLIAAGISNKRHLSATPFAITDRKQAKLINREMQLWRKRRQLIIIHQLQHVSIPSFHGPLADTLAVPFSDSTRLPSYQVLPRSIWCSAMPLSIRSPLLHGLDP